MIQKRRNKHAALKLLRKLLKNQGIHPETITTDKLGSCRAAVLRTPTLSSADESDEAWTAATVAA